MISAVRLRKAVREIIQHQEKIAMDGGTTEKEYQWLQLKRKKLLRQLGLECSDDMVRILFDYPFSPLVDITDPCTVSTCPKLQSRIARMYLAGVMDGIMPMWAADGKIYGIENKVKCVLDNIIGVTGIYFE